MSTRWCANCGYSLDADAARCPQCGHAEAVAPVTAGSLPGPHRAALPVMAVLTAVFTPAPLLLLWVRAANDAPDWLWPVAVAGTALCATFLLLGLLIAWLDRRQRQRSAAFLNSDRLLLRWTYEPEEWLAIRKLAWQEQAGDWQVQLGCLALLIALAGVLAGGMVGLEEDWGTAVRDALIGGAAALGVGLLLGAGVAGGNRLAARRDLQRKTPGWVGLAPGEIYAVDSYFYGDGQIRAVRQATLEKGEMPVLRLALKVPEGPRNPERDTWDIAVPPRLVGAVTAVLPHLPNRSAKAPTQS